MLFALLWIFIFYKDFTASSFKLPKDEGTLKRSNSQVDLNSAEIPQDLTAEPICLPDSRSSEEKAKHTEEPVNEELHVRVSTSDFEDDMEGKFGRKNKDAVSEKRQAALPISGGVRRLLQSRKNQRQIKYATYSPKRSGSTLSRNSYYDNVDDNDYPKRNGERSLQGNDLAYSQDGYIQDSDIVNNQNRKISSSEICVEGLSTPGSIDNPVISATTNGSRTSSPRRFVGPGSNSTSPRNASSVDSHSPSLPLGPGVLKSAKFIEDNAANFELANTIRIAGNHHETMNGNFISPNRAMTLKYGNSAGGRLENGAGNAPKTKRSHSFNTRTTNSLSNDNNVDRLERYNEEDNTLVQDYEAHLRNITDNSDSGFDGTLPESESCTNHSASMGQGPLLPKWRKRKTFGSDSGSSSGVRGDNGTMTSSEGRHSQHDVDFLDSTDGKDFYIRDEDDHVEEEEEESQSLSSLHSQTSCYQQGGATRKAGWLNVKSMLVQRKRKLERATKRSWKEYWVCLKGTMLLFYTCSEKTAPDENSEPRHILVVEDGLAQAVPEHPKRDNIFCLSTAFGDAYLLQANNQIELENWVTAIHSACSSAFARQHGKDDTLRLLKSQNQKLEDQIDQENKTKKMAELQLMTVSDAKNRLAIVNQISQWEQNLEKLHLELYRLRCYSTSLQGTELPNPKTLLACVGKQTKAHLGRLGFFSVSSFHALVSARNPAGIQGRFTKPKSKKQKSFFGTLKKHKDKSSSQHCDTSSTSTPVAGEHEDVEPDFEDEEEALEFEDTGQSFDEDTLVSHNESTTSDQLSEGSLVKVLLPDDQSSMVTVRPGMTVHDLLISSCTNRKMDYHNYYVRFKVAMRYGANYNIPDKTAILSDEKYDEIEICTKSIHQVELYKVDESGTFGLSLEAELGDDIEQEDQLCVFISSLESGGLAYHQDLQVGDEILVFNGRVVCDLDMLYIENLLQTSTSLTLTVRSCRSVFAQTQAMQDTNRYIDQLTCPPPPLQTRLTDEMIDTLIVPSPAAYEDQEDEDQSSESSTNPSIPGRDGTPLPPASFDTVTDSISNGKEKPPLDNKQIEQLMKNAEQVTEFCRTLEFRQSVRRNNFTRSVGARESQLIDMPPLEVLQAAQKLRKVITELLDTERAYVRDLNCLVSRYLEPLQNEAFLSADEIDALFGNIKEIIKFQTTFLKSLEDPISKQQNFSTLDNPDDFKRILFSLGGSFLYYMEHFKLYSAFCACHSRSQKILDPAKGNSALMQFLEARNPKQQHSASLASYLIKPIQRVLKYPLLLSEMRTHLDRDSYEHYHLSEALKGMNKVAEHINDMMRVHEEYGAVFDTLVAEQFHIKKEIAGSKVHELAMDDLVKYENMTWLNCHDDLPKYKKGREPEVTVFVFRPAVVIICKERSRKKSMVKLSGTGTLKGNPEDLIKFKWMVPISAMQVKETCLSETDYLSLWELVHLKGEGKTEKVFQFSFCSSDLRNSFLKVLRQTLRDYHRSKTTPGGGSKFNIKKNYTPYGGKRFENLGRNKRTLRKTMAKSDGGSSAGQSEAGSLGSEERSSESGSHRSDPNYDDTDSTGTGRGSFDHDRREPSSIIITSLQRQESEGSLNCNGNNSLQRGTSCDSSIPNSPASPGVPPFTPTSHASHPNTRHSEDPLRTLTPESSAVTQGSKGPHRPLTLDLSLVHAQQQASTPSEPYTPNLEDIRARLAEIEMAVEDHH
ncbi:T-lymphoma invasion and metastasis-inducing protein 2-like isoform X2 [Lytechinus variegatus]|uniref:T-lymphoma invasion and metastasis-inducing protein 2-like isoform X2 n=1 Tax=Lytechinus variegatus TaxID=7654 RepID=UPI001BB16655|nr:T-lymphoma invasion and metastasis-inducing protein 2-like isoform X2 [Lytechinus variegatus]